MCRLLLPIESKHKYVVTFSYYFIKNDGFGTHFKSIWLKNGGKQHNCTFQSTQVWLYVHKIGCLVIQKGYMF